MIHRMRRLILPFMLALLFLIPEMAWANSAPPRWYGDKAGAVLPGTVLPGTSSQIHVLREDLHFDLTGPLTSAKVTAAYEMENRGGPLSHYPVVFATQTIGAGAAPAITWNGNPVAVEQVAQQGLSAADAVAVAQAWTAMDQVIDPVTGQRYSTQGFFEKPRLQLYQFALDLPAGVKGKLEVRFAQVAARDNTRELHPLFHYQYLLLPARAWASFGPLSISVTAPPPEQAFFGSTLPMTYQDGQYRASLPGLPDQNLAFSLMSKEGMILGWGTPGPYYWSAFFLLLIWAVLIGYGLGRLSGLIRSRGGAIVTAVLTSLTAGGLADVIGCVLALWLFEKALSNQGYGMAFVIAGQTFVAVLATAVVAIIVADRTSRRRAAARVPLPPVPPDLPSA